MGNRAQRKLLSGRRLVSRNHSSPSYLSSSLFSSPCQFFFQPYMPFITCILLFMSLLSFSLSPQHLILGLLSIYHSSSLLFSSLLLAMHLFSLPSLCYSSPFLSPFLLIIALLLLICHSSPLLSSSQYSPPPFASHPPVILFLLSYRHSYPLISSPLLTPLPLQFITSYFALPVFF